MATEYIFIMFLTRQVVVYSAPSVLHICKHYKAIYAHAGEMKSLVELFMTSYLSIHPGDHNTTTITKVSN